MDGKSQAWRDAAQRLIEALARENKYIVSDMVILFLESAGYGLDDYAPLGGAFRRAAAAGIIGKIDQPRKKSQALWISKLYDGKAPISTVPVLIKDQLVAFRGFGGVDTMTFKVADIEGDTLRLERIS